jgi:phosphoribosyl 1,2-cyclic phosphodiesterase
MKLKVLASSSAGNCYILETPTDSLILDCGIPFMQVKQGLNFDLSPIKGLLLTHEHGDHSKGIREAMKSGIDVYSSKGTIEMLESDYRACKITNGKQISIGDFTVLPFDTQHDCAEPLGYLIQYRPTGEKLLFATDTYYIKYKFNGLNYIMLECNYCPDILRANVETGRVPVPLKNRLLESHFSLDNVKEFLRVNDLRECRKIILIHLSDGNSDEARMQREVQELTGIDTVIADKGKEIELELYPF